MSICIRSRIGFLYSLEKIRYCKNNDFSLIVIALDNYLEKIQGTFKILLVLAI